MPVDHLALAVRDRGRSQRFYEAYLGFDAEPAREYDDGVLMLYNAAGFALALGPSRRRSGCPFLHFGVGVDTRMRCAHSVTGSWPQAWR